MKRLRTRQRFVNLSEEKAAQKQQHCKSSIKNVNGMKEVTDSLGPLDEEVVRAFESALALLQAK